MGPINARGAAAGSWLFAALAVLPLLASAQEGLPEAKRWLDRMAGAVSNLTYRGTLVYLRQEQVDSLRIYHRVDEAGMRERLVALNGSPREVLRDNDTVRCIFPDRRSVVVDTRIAERLFPTIPADLSSLSEGRYKLSLGGTDRVAQLEAQVIEIAAADDFRYGYRLWLEKNTGMLLKSSLIDLAGRAIEQVLFTEIDIGAVITDQELQPDSTGDGYVEVALTSPQVAVPATGPAGWQVGELPAGFYPLGQRRAGSLNHLLFSDGLAVVSVYVEPAATDEVALQGFSRVGAMNIFARSSGGFAVTAVGEVPRSTLKIMATSVSRQAKAGSSQHEPPGP